ncbi:MAG TPA: stalk domain-containing protein [Azospirillaceae bacterium]|nr:stalk domain-containing protein [Azospirillaceae bacterium]
MALLPTAALSLALASVGEGAGAPSEPAAPILRVAEAASQPRLKPTLPPAAPKPPPPGSQILSKTPPWSAPNGTQAAVVPVPPPGKQRNAPPDPAAPRDPQRGLPVETLPARHRGIPGQTRTSVPLTPPPVVPAVPAQPAASPVLERRYEADLEELVVDVYLRKSGLIQGTIVFLRGDEVLVPLREIAEALEIAIDADEERGVADGWVVEESRRFGLDVHAREAVVDGQKRPIAPGDAMLLDGAIFVSGGLLGRLWPVQVSLNQRESHLYLDPREPLPIEERLQREDRRAKLSGARRSDRKELPPRHPSAHGFLSVPSLDVAVDSGYERGPGPFLNHSILAAGDFAWMSARLTITGDEGVPVRSGRFSLERADDAGGVLGIGPLREFVLGDVVTPSIGLVANSRLNRGVYFSTTPLDFNPEFDRVTLDGDGPAGYEAELYLDGDLIAVQRVGPTGRYVFDDVPLTSGNNRFRVVLYGPQGQKIEETRNVLISTGLLAKGASATRFSLTQSGRSVFDSVRRAPNAPDRADQAAVTLEHDRGVGEMLTLSGFAAHVPVRDRIRLQRRLDAPIVDRGPADEVGQFIPDPDEEDVEQVSEQMDSFAGLGFRSAALGSFLRGDAVMTAGGGTAFKGAVNTAIGPVNLSLGHGEYHDFESAVLGQGDSAQRRGTDFRLVGSIPPGLLPRTTVDLQGLRAERTNGSVTQELAASFRNRFDGLAVHTYVAGRSTDNPGAPARYEAIASLDLGYRLGVSELSVAYIHDIWDGKAQRLVATLSDDRFTDTSFVAQGAWDFESGVGTVGASATRSFRRFAGGLQARLDTDGGVYVGLGFTFSLGATPQRTVVSRNPLASGGSVAGRVFHDIDRDGRFGPGDKPMDGARLTVNGSARDGDTADGEVLVSGLTSGVPVAMHLDPAAVDNPFLQPAASAVTVVPRPGVVIPLDMPMVELGEIEGLVLVGLSDGEMPLRGVTVEVVAATGEVRTARTAFDGVFNLGRMEPGDYTLRLAPDQKYRGRAIAAKPVAFTLSAEDLSRFDLHLDVRYADDGTKPADR